MSSVRGKDQRVGDPKGIQKFLAVSLTTFATKAGHIKKNCMKYKEMLKKKGSTESDGLVLVESQIKLGLSKKQMRIHVIS